MGQITYRDDKESCRVLCRFRCAASDASIYTLFRFVKQHYIRWVFLLFFNLVWYESKLPIFSFFFLYFTKEEGSDIYLDG
jgi:hypothetical protein